MDLSTRRGAQAAAFVGAWVALGFAFRLRPDAYLVAVLPVLLVAIFGLMAWIVRELGRISNANSTSEVVIAHLERTVNDHAERIHDLEMSR